ncbi:MAG TPA: glycogen synthase GlgA [Candidatus Acidoferrales bacterium]|nr:glycogen synthase GlgA [Candidatus Acidoferrales bacterium]
MKILFVSPEGLPFSKTGGLADVVEALPRALAEMGHQVGVLLPRYRGNQASRTVLASLSITLGTKMQFPAIEEAGTFQNVHYYFVDDPEYFDREKLYGDKAGDYPDNPLRFAELGRAAIEFAKQIWMPDVMHCHDWQSALVPVYLRTLYARDPAVASLPVVLTVHNLGYQGLFARNTLGLVGFPEELFRMEALEYYGKVNFLKGGLIFSDYLTTVSRKYSQEIQTPEFGCGLEGVIRARGERMVGILNGVDYAAWNPETDTHIAAQYSAKNLEGKRLCKKDLLSTFRLPAENMERPLIGIVSRFADQKGFDLIADTAPEMMKEDLALVALGNGEPKYEKLFQEIARKNPKRVGVKIAYDNAVAHKIEAGADMFLMPSRYEPCGLNQIYSLKYGTVPVVRATGGLDDTVEEFDARTGKGTGFKFRPYEGNALLECLRQALAAFGDLRQWRLIQANGMAKDFSWKPSAEAYVTVYEAARRSRVEKMAVSSNS